MQPLGVGYSTNLNLMMRALSWITRMPAAGRFLFTLGTQVFMYCNSTYPGTWALSSGQAMDMLRDCTLGTIRYQFTIFLVPAEEEASKASW